MSFFPAPPPPVSPLNRYRLLSPTASVRVSPLCLGAMNFGSAWKDFLGDCDKATSEAILDFFYEQVSFSLEVSLGFLNALVGGLPRTWLTSVIGNFIDTANNYQYEESEAIIGDWMKKRGNRHEMVIATKYTTCYKLGPVRPHIAANFTGNGTKSLHASVEASLQKLQTDYIDLLYVHWWDYATSIPELMQSLNNLVVSGKVLYLGISDAPAWVVSKANEYARNHGFRQFSVYQGRWSAASRDFERDIIPMCRDEGMALAPWGALGGGKFKTEEQRNSEVGRKVQATEVDIQVSKVLERIAQRKNTALTSVALAYVMQKTPYVFPIVGGRNIDQLKGNIEALTLQLTDEDVEEIEGAYPFDIGFPNSMLWGGKQPSSSPQKIWLLESAAHYEYVAGPKPIAPTKIGE